MMVRKSQTLAIRPYARILTMLGEQLIKNERVALIELIKNCYDADASWVKITFENFGKNYEVTPLSRIIIEDNGDGMSAHKIETSWLHPATPDKKIWKESHPQTKKGRLIQGEKGIGRYAILKLGKKTNLITRARGENVEQIVDYDLSRYDDDFLSVDKKSQELFIDEIPIKLISQPAEKINKNPVNFGIRKLKQDDHGTIIEISNLKGSWNDAKIEAIYLDITKLLSIFPGDEIEKKKADFSVQIFKDNELQSYSQDYINKFQDLLNDRSVFQIKNGHYDEKNKLFKYELNGKPMVLKLSDPAIRGLYVYRNYFQKNLSLENRTTECGDFDFSFYVFDFSSKAPNKFRLDTKDKNIIRPHRIYLYRDRIRVYPYGEPEDDWLHIDQHRGTISAGTFLSNDQLVGSVQITQAKNKNLSDKTNREGLIEVGNAASDFIALLQVFLSYIRAKDYQRYRLGLEDKIAQDIVSKDAVKLQFEALREAADDSPKIKRMLIEAEKQYTTEKKYLQQRAETTENLAGVGLSVEAASHDITAFMHKALVKLDALIRDTAYEDADLEEVNTELASLKGLLTFVENQLKDVQLLFSSSKQRRKNIRVGEVLEKVERIYKQLLKKNKITLNIDLIGSPLIAKTTDAVLLQLFINLIDNSIYWLNEADQKNKEILITMDGNNGELIFSDNGPGIHPDDQPYIFEAMYSGKGEEGRGLGLYIARQLLERSDYSIDLAKKKTDKRLNGANFVVSFVTEE